jgi:hypothetical protein
VADDGEQVDAERGDVDGDLSRGLGGVGVEREAVAVRDAGEVGDGLDGAGLVVRNMIDTRTVCGVIAATRSCGSMRPCRSTGRTVTSTPWSRCRARQVARTAGCSVAWVITCAWWVGLARTVPRMARLLASDPEPVKTIPSAVVPMSVATCSRAVRTAWAGAAA